MIIIRQKIIYRSDIKVNPQVLYIFGDNLDRMGFGGQAREMRGEPNSLGIATKRSISHNYPDDYFFDGQDGIYEIIDEEFRRLHKELRKKIEGDWLYQAIVIPTDGIGTGLSRLPETAPKLLEYINKKLKELENL